MNHTLTATLTGHTIATLRVEAWDATGVIDDLIDVAVSDARGRFTMSVDEDYVAVFSGDDPTVVFRIFDAAGNLFTQAKPAAWKLARQSTQLTIPVTAAGPSAAGVRGPAIGQAVVRGTLRDGQGNPIANRPIRAFDRNLSAAGFIDTQLGQTTSESDGQYELHYSMAAGAKLKPDLIVKVDGSRSSGTITIFGPIAMAVLQDQPHLTLAATTAAADVIAPSILSSKVAEALRPTAPVAAPIAAPPPTPTPTPTPAPHPTPTPTPPAATPAVQSDVINNAPTIVLLDLGLDGTTEPVRSEHGTFADNVAAVLARSKVALADLKPEHVDYAAGVAGVQSDRLAQMAQAAQLARQAGNTVPEEIFYGLLRAGFKGDLTTLVEEPVSLLRAQIEHAIHLNLISSSYEPTLDAITKAIHDLAVRSALPTQGATPTSSMLANAATAQPAAHQAFVGAWVAREGNGDDAWDSIRQTLPTADADDLELTTRLHVLFAGYQPALAELKTRRQAGSVKSMRDLARWQDGDWTALVGKTGAPTDVAGANAGEQRAGYAKGLQAVVRAALPTEYLRGVAAQPVPALSIKLLPALAAANPTLDLARPLPDDPDAPPAWGAIAAADQPAARAEWAAFAAEARTFRKIPARALLAQVVAAAGANLVRASANRVLAASTVDLENTTLDEHLAATPTFLAGVAAEHRDGVVHHLKSVQRLLRIVEAPEAVHVLLADGLDSAHRIARVGRASFVERYASVFADEATAHRAFSAAYRLATTAQVALATVAQTVADASPWAVRGGSTVAYTRPDYAGALALLKSHAQADAATWPSLFGADAFCDCDECQSALGPAAYLVDLLHMIDPDDKVHTPADRLFTRRPDLQHLPLTCDNTNTPIPYIDLVNEILEAHLARRSLGIAVAPSYDSAGRSADELRAVPQNVITAVYDHLAGEPYPFSLPFDRSLAVMRAYLDQLGTSYGEILQLFGPRAGGDILTHGEQVAAEQLGLSRRQFMLIAEVPPADPSTARTTPELYGYAKDAATWMTSLSSVPELLVRTGLRYDDLYAIIHTFFVNPSRQPGVRVQLERPHGSQIAGTHVLAATEDTWKRLHRFIRLWRATSWSIDDLDRVLFAVGSHAADHSITLDRDTLRRVGLAARAIDALDQPLASVLTLWSRMDTWGPGSLYLRLFENKTVARIDADDPTRFDLTPASFDPDLPLHRSATGYGELLHATDKLADHLPRVLAALRISAADLAAIQAHAGLGPDTTLALDNLTTLYRYTVLAKGLGLRITDLVTLLTLTGAAPFGSPGQALDFLETAGVVASSGFTAPALDYLFRHVAAPGRGPAPSDSVVRDALVKVWNALRAVRQDTAIADDPDGTLLSARLALVQPAAVVGQILDVLDPAKGQDAATRARVLADHLGPILHGGEQAVLAAPDPDPTDADTYAARAEQRKRDNQAAMLALVSTWLRTSLSRSSVISVVASTLGLTDAMTNPLLSAWIPGDTGSALDTLLLLAGGGLTAHTFAAPAFGGAETVTTGAIDLQTTGGGDVHSARWVGHLLPQGDGDHVFVVRTNGAVTIAIGAAAHTIAATAAVADTEITIALTAGSLVPITVTLDDSGHAAKLELLWRLAAAPTAQPIAAESLFPDGGLAALDDGHGPGFAWRRAHKASLLIGGLGLSEAEIAYAESSANPFGALHLRDLPMTTPAADVGHAQLAWWNQLATFVAVRAALPDADVPLAGAFAARDPAAPLAAWAPALCSATGWDVAATASLLGTTTIADWSAMTTTSIVALLARCIDLVGRVGVSGATLRGWTSGPPRASDADAVVKAVRARYPEDAEWFDVARTRNDALRQQQRDALVAHTMAHLLINGAPPVDVNALFEHFLVDVEMCACGLTSRVKQAISSVQLFIQRIMLGLEAQISPRRIDPDAWEWNAEYRIWQANREIFLYPENWIDPDLRVDKTPFFADLQSELSQSPLEPDAIEDAFRTYLDKLVDVSRLQICAVHWQREAGSDSDSAIAPDDSIDTLHVVARSHGAHPTYYYRTLLGASRGNGGTEWTPWQKIDLDILGDGATGDVHMVLATYDRRVYLFWTQFTEVPEPTQPGSNQGDSPAPSLTHWEVRLAWSTFRNGAWSAKQTSSDKVISKRFVSSDPKDLKAFKTAIKEFEHQAKQAHASYAMAQALVLSTEILLFALIQDLRKKLAQRTWFVLDSYAWYFEGSTFDAIEKRCKQDHTTLEDVLDDVYDDYDDPDNRLAPTRKALDDLYDSLTSQRKHRDALKSAYDKLEKSVKAFKSGKSDLAVPAYTRKTDHTLWLSDESGIDLYLMRHDDATNVFNLGVFSLSGDGRSITAAATDERMDISRQIPHHSEPRINHFTIQTAKHTGLDLEGLPNLLGKVHATQFTNEHWLYHPVTADSMRPFFVAKDSDVHVGLPNVRESDVPRWKPAATVGRARARVSGKVGYGVTARELNPPLNVKKKKYLFEPFHHPYTHAMVRRLERDGIDGLLTNAAQNPGGADHGEAGGHFDDVFEPNGKFVWLPYAPHDVDFRPQGPYAQYNWELFFHAPHLIASRLMADGRYDDARRWLHYIFDPTTQPSKTDTLPQAYWKLQWFRDHDGTTDAEHMMTALAKNSPPDRVAKIQAQIEQWHRHPADPHRIAALRTSAYRKAIVFKYLDNLIAWADSLFTQNTIETINQATQLYVFASHLLGPRPEHVPQQPKIAPFSYADLRGGLDDMSDMLGLVESTMHPHAHKQHQQARPIAHAMIGISHLPVTFQSQPAAPADDDGKQQVKALCFCVPSNPKLQTYFDTIDDRLFKIRNCMNIEGEVEQLPLFDPPIDPALLVRAAAMGLDIGSILSDLSAPLPFHRFMPMLQKATEVANEVKSLGGQLLSALEKKDAETMAALRASHETSLLSAVKNVKKQQLDDAKLAKTALEKGRAVTQAKYDYYASREYTNAHEDSQISSTRTAMILKTAAGVLHEVGAASSYSLPTLEIGPTGMGVHGTASFSGLHLGGSIAQVAAGMTIASEALQAGGSIAGIQGSFDRRRDEWSFQQDLAKKELAQIDKQLASADIKIAIAQLELDNQQLQIDHAKKIEDTLRTKYTNVELYQWMLTQISATYYQAYKLAYDLAKRAERCYRYELGVPSSSFIQFGYWDSLRRGLLAGEQLALDLKRLDAAYLAADRRDFELTRQVSLVLHDPAAFVRLRETGSCVVDLPEELFDSDYPGHYFRRLKTVSLTLPCVAGPYTPINCTLTLLSSRVRTSATAPSRPTSYPEHDAPDDPRFSHAYGAIQSVATSHGQNDAGLFEINFRDERYLPFEGAGAISKWRIDLPRATNGFDFDTLSDVVMKLSFTARDGGQPLARSARQWLVAQRKAIDPVDGVAPSTPLGRLFRVRYEFSDEWIAFRNALTKGAASLSLTLDPDRFPYLFRGVKMAITSVKLYATTADPLAAFEVTVIGPDGSSTPVTLTPTPDPTILAPNTGWPTTKGSTVRVAAGAAGTWQVAAAAGSPIAKARDLLVVATYLAELPVVK